MAFVLDSNIYIELERKNKKIIDELSKLKEPEIVCITAPSYSEVYYGLLAGKKSESKKELDNLNSFYLLNTTANSSRLFSEIKYGLEKSGKMIPLFDILIASIAIDNGMTLLTTDEHFEQIPGLKIILLVL
ncbi:MAG: PIN domain-containing protein [Candidatus Woesearchaeota archaeon]|nr:PIN domain-containing protein [Candidatus Woesearchaeota archaeon]